MPWTFAHPAAVLPLRKVLRGQLSFGALVVGSMAPDFAFYFGSFPVSRKAHTLAGLFSICLPSGLLLIALILTLHKPIGGLLPSPHRQRILALAPFRSLGNLPGLIWTSIALLIGGLTHLAWDSFTHESGYSVLHWPFLQTKIAFPGGKTSEVYELLQIISSVLGAVIVILAYKRWIDAGDTVSRTQAPADDRWRYWLLTIIAIAAPIAAAPFAYHVSLTANGVTKPVLFLVRLVIYSTTAFFTLLCLASLAVARRAPNIPSH
jgi:hypothetical protein